MGENPSVEELAKVMSEKREEVIKVMRMYLEECPTKENWDRFSSITSKICGDCSELCADWPQLQNLLTSHLLFPSSSPSSPSSSSSQQSESVGAPPPAVKSEEVAILVPACGNSRLSEHLYDAGFTNITNVDFSKVVITQMMRRNVRERPRMKWRAMDMINMQFANETFDAIVDKGGLDVLTKPTLGPRLGNLYVSEVKRLLKAGGKYICVTLAECEVLGILFPRFRFGWKVNLYVIAPEPSSGDLNQQSFMVVAEKLVSTFISQISSFLDEYSVESQAHKLDEALERENKIRRDYSDTCDMYKPLEDLKTNLKELEPGRRVKLTLGLPAVSRFCYNCILLDAQQDFGPFSIQFLVFILPSSRNLEWIVTFSRQQWVYVQNFKTARLLMVVLDSRHSSLNTEDIQKDLSPLVKQLVPGDCDGVKISFRTLSDGIKQEEIVHQVTCAGHGLMVVDDVIYEKAHNPYIPGKDLIVRGLTTESLVQSKALLTREGPIGISSEVEKRKMQATSKTRKKGKHKNTQSHSSGSHGDASSGVLKVLHNHLVSLHHNAIIAGLMLISLHLKRSTSVEGLVKTMFIGLIPLFQIQTVVIGLGAGVLPMFMNKWLPYLTIEVVELDDMVLNVAREYFDFKEGGRLKVSIANGSEFIIEKANSDAIQADRIGSSKIDILIVDVNSPKSSCPLNSPAPDFVTKSFLSTAKDSLSEEGLFVINLVTRSSKMKGEIYSNLKKVFSNLFSLELEEDVSEVIFALKTDSPINEDHLSEACDALVRLLEFEKPEWGERVIEASRLIKPLKFVDENL